MGERGERERDEVKQKSKKKVKKERV